MLEDKIAIFKSVIDLARRRREADENESINVSSEGYKKYKEYKVSEEEKALDSYFNSLDFEVVKMIQSIMYLGRDRDYDKSDLPSEIYRKNREYMDQLGWATKEIEINQMVEKLPLDTYLQNGFRILEINL